ncbi:MAG: hypothetical protein HY912_19820 [Desulfomonile tiedjei]|uniref:Heavy-metal-associated domain-containing protein n=1 Tax=Desulfomonile tiedjei TaxID=2358 RepID=A0A9D6V589_9BACT|nr:hypothetical protein [Desulfomonile tiedjei]
MAYYVHEVPGRLRIKIPNLKRNPQLAEDLQELLNSLSGINSISVNTVIGSMIVLYDPETVSSGAILTFLSREGYIDVAKAISSEQHLEQALGAVGKAASKALIGFALDRALQGSPFAILAAFI